MIRYYCVVATGPGPSAGFDYLEALSKTGILVRACPLGPVFLASGPWAALAHLFQSEIPSGPYVNVVCAPPGMPLGVPMTGKMAGGNRAPGLEGHSARATEEVVYRPKTALEGLWTAEVRNVAITAPWPDPSAEELEVLGRYDLVLCPSGDHVKKFADLGITARRVLPDPQELGILLAGLL